MVGRALSPIRPARLVSGVSGSRPRRDRGGKLTRRQDFGMRDRSLQVPLSSVRFIELDRELLCVKWCGGGSVKEGAQALDGVGFFRERGPPKSRAHARTMRLTRGPSASAASPQSPHFRHLSSSGERNPAQDGRGIVFVISRFYLNIVELAFLCRQSRRSPPSQPTP